MRINLPGNPPTRPKVDEPDYLEDEDIPIEEDETASFGVTEDGRNSWVASLLGLVSVGYFIIKSIDTQQLQSALTAGAVVSLFAVVVITTAGLTYFVTSRQMRQRLATHDRSDAAYTQVGTEAAAPK